MAEKTCPSCAMRVDKKATACPVCGHEFRTFSIWQQAIAIFLLLLFLLYFIL
jgi:RNA polymerase subunit RPABC4/transcription elongation factor Spt4